MSEQPAWSLPLWKVREKSQELRLDPSLLSLATGSSSSRCPRRKSLFPSGKNLSTIGYLTGGQFPTLSLPSYGLLTKPLPVSWCMSPAKTDPLFGNYIFPCIPLVWWFNEFPVPVWLYSSATVGQTTLRGGVFYMRNRQLWLVYLGWSDVNWNKSWFFIFFFSLCKQKSPNSRYHSVAISQNVFKMLKETKHVYYCYFISVFIMWESMENEHWLGKKYFGTHHPALPQWARFYMTAFWCPLVLTPKTYTTP